MRLNLRRAYVHGLLLTLTLILLAGRPATVVASDAALVAAATKEGSLVVYACDPPQTPVYLEAFKKRYPQIKVTSYLAGCWQLYNRHVTEREAGKQAADVIFSVEDVLTRMQAEKLLDPYHSPELAHFPADAAPPGKDYQRVKVLIQGIAADKAFTKGMVLPQDWSDFANPRKEWYGQITFYDPRTSSGAFMVLAALYQNFGAQKTAAIYQGLVKAGAELTPTTPAGMAKMLSGEKPLMFYIVNNHFSGAVAKGAPLKFIVPTSGAIAQPFSIAVLAGAPHPAAARLFVDFMMSDVQTIIQHANEYALRDGAKPPQGMPDITTLKVLPLNIDAALGQQKMLINLWQQATGIR